MLIREFGVPPILWDVGEVLLHIYVGASAACSLQVRSQVAAGATLDLHASMEPLPSEKDASTSTSLSGRHRTPRDMIWYPVIFYSAFVPFHSFCSTLLCLLYAVVLHSFHCIVISLSGNIYEFCMMLSVTVCDDVYKYVYICICIYICIPIR